MDRHYSTLELAKHDETARAPERDYDATAFELDTSALAPETVPDTTPQVLYDNSLPEAHGNEKPTEEHLHVTKLTRKWPWIVIALILAAVIAIGVSVGIWHHREYLLYKPPRISSPPASNITYTPQYILNDTSLAAVSLSNGDRHLFFQDNTGLIRRAVRVESNGQWTTTPNLNASADPSSEVISNPKRNTPLTAIGPTEGQPDRDMSLYYISENHTVCSNVMIEGSWGQDQYFGGYSTAVDTRSLSIILFSVANDSSNLNNENSTTNIALLYYENPNGKVSALLYRPLTVIAENQNDGPYLLDQWIDITSQESKALPNEFRNAPGFNYSDALYTHSGYGNATFSHTLYEADPIAVYSTPFCSAPNTFGVSVAWFYSPFNLPLNAITPLAGDSFFAASYMVGLNGSGNFSLTEYTPPSKDYASIHQSDIAAFGIQSGIWINGTQPALIQTEYDESTTLPSNEFPFTRLASVTLTDGSATYLYHQMNGTTFAEEQWDDTLRAWVRPEYITVSDS